MVNTDLKCRVPNASLTMREYSAGMTNASPPAAADAPLAGSTGPVPRLAMFAVWLAIVAYLAAHHVFWRDEVRAFSLALSGDDVVAMARAVHGEGHPLVWYLLLRAAHALVPVREALPAVGLAIGIAGAGFFAWRAPFRPIVIAAVLFGGWMAFEYTVMARNYGISMLLMFVIADRYARRRDGVWSMGALLFLLCNTNVPSVILAGGFLLFRLVEIVAEQGWRPSPALGRWCGTAAICLAGAVACFLTVYPPFNEAAVSPLADHLSPAAVVTEVVAAALDNAVILALLVVAGPLSLVRRPAGFVAGAVVLPLFLLFFLFVYPGSYRHQALYLCFLVALHWMAAAGRGGWWRGGGSASVDRVARIAAALFAALLLVQWMPTASLLVQVAEGRVESQTSSLAQLLARPPLRHAIVMSIPEVQVEPLRYYAANPTYLLRRRRFDAVTHFTRRSDMHLTLGGVLATARRLQVTTGRPVVILMQYPLSHDPAAIHWDEHTLGDVTARPGEAAAFLDATRQIAAPVRLIRYGFFDERYWVYVLKPAVAPGVTGS